VPLEWLAAPGAEALGLAGDLAEQAVRVLEGDSIALQILVALALWEMPVAPPVLVALVPLVMWMVPPVSLEPNLLPEDPMKNCGHESMHWQAASYGGQ
jgi:hypothetical protein